jgi:hypothetical protein
MNRTHEQYGGASREEILQLKKQATKFINDIIRIVENKDLKNLSDMCLKATLFLYSNNN